MNFSFEEIFKKIKNDGLIEDSKEKLDILRENTYHAQKMMQMGSWTYIVNDDQIILSDEMYSIYESDYNRFDNSFDGFNLYFHPDDKVEALKNIEQLASGKNYDIEFRIITKEGNIKFIREKTSIIYDEDGKLIKIIGVIQDITNQKIIEQDLISIDNDLNDNKRIDGVGNWKYNILKSEYYFSEEVYNIHDIEPQEFRNDYRNLINMVHKDDKLKLKELIAKAKEGKKFEAEYRIFIKNGSMRYIRTLCNPIYNVDGEVIALYGNVKDITEKKELDIKLEDKEKKIHDVQEKFQNIIRESKDGFEILNKGGLITYSSDSVEKITKLSPKEILNTPIFDLFKGKEVEVVKEMLNYVLKNPKKSIEGNVKFTNKYGLEMYLEIFMSNVLNDPSIQGIVVNFRDITKRKTIENQMIYDANYDALTGLMKRDYFLKGLNQLNKEADSQGYKYALMMIHIDDLKHINFSFGYALGDKLILEITNRLKTVISNDAYISRYSEDHFAIIVEDGINEKSYEKVAERIIGLSSEPFKIDSYEFSIAINIGICAFPKDEDDKLPLNNSAKIALIRSKNLGRNTYRFYSSELNIRYYKEYTLRKDLKHAIENEQLEVYFQPLINLKDNVISGAEALIRWNHPEWGLVPPGEFISIAEETELIIDIGKWVLEEVCENYKRWISDGLPHIEIGLNLSGIQFFEKDFTDNIKNILEKFNLAPDFLVMEITENVILKNKEKINEDIKVLRSMGIKIALDDFGTGYSSLSYLSALSVDILKLDKSFIKNVPSDIVGAAVAKATVKLAKEINLKIVAEGIENWDQLNFLKKLNCSTGQGFIYSKARPIKEFEKLLARKKWIHWMKKMMKNCINMEWNLE